MSIVVPLFNDEAVVLELLEALREMGEAVGALDHRVEYVFVDDGSTDGTAFALSVRCRGRADVRVVAHPVRRGAGDALRAGIEAARGSVVVTYAADRPYPPRDAALLVEAVQGPEGADVATVSPWAVGGRAEGVPALRRLLSRTAAHLYAAVLGRRAAGLTCFTAPFRAYKGEVVRSLDSTAPGPLVDAELLVAALRRGCRVIEIAATLTWRRRPRHGGTLRMAAAHARFLLALGVRRRRGDGRGTGTGG